MWKNININKQNIEIETAKAVLVKMPNNSDYKGFKFWHTKKLVRPGRNSNALQIGYNDEFEFKIFKNGNGKYNEFEKINEMVILVPEFEEAFGIMDENINAPDSKSDYETHKPEELEIENVEIVKELRDE